MIQTQNTNTKCQKHIGAQFRIQMKTQKKKNTTHKHKIIKRPGRQGWENR